MRRRRGDHVHQFGLVRRRHHHHTRQIGHEGHVERPGMRRAIRPDQTGAINRKPHRQPLYRHVMHHLVITALQERRINRAERLHPARRQGR